MNAVVTPFRASQYGVEAGLVADALGKLNKGESVSYIDLSKVAGIDVLKFRHVISSARRTLHRDKQMVFEPVKGFGLSRMDDEQMVGFGIKAVKKVGRLARRSMKVVESADYELLSAPGKVRHVVSMTILNAMQHTSTQSTIKKVENASLGSRVLPLKQTLVAMLS